MPLRSDVARLCSDLDLVGGNTASTDVCLEACMRRIGKGHTRIDLLWSRRKLWLGHDCAKQDETLIASIAVKAQYLD